MSEFRVYGDSKINAEVIDQHIDQSAYYICARLAELLNDETEINIQQKSGLNSAEYWRRVVLRTIDKLQAQIDTASE